MECVDSAVLLCLMCFRDGRWINAFFFSFLFLRKCFFLSFILYYVYHKTSSQSHTHDDKINKKSIKNTFSFPPSFSTAHSHSLTHSLRMDGFLESTVDTEWLSPLSGWEERRISSWEVIWCQQEWRFLRQRWRFWFPFFSLSFSSLFLLFSFVLVVFHSILYSFSW